MDTNYLLGRHQHSLHRAENAGSPEARLAHAGLARGYAERLRTLQDANGGTAFLRLAA